jgi:hypothetical protein
MAQQPQTQLSASSASTLACLGNTGGAFVMATWSTVQCVLIARQAANQVWGPEVMCVRSFEKTRTLYLYLLHVMMHLAQSTLQLTHHVLAEQGNI